MSTLSTLSGGSGLGRRERLGKLLRERLGVRLGVDDALFGLGLAALLIAVCALPVFPSGDGPVHVYFARILFALARGAGGVYEPVYTVRHLLQPYALHYVWLGGAGRFLSPEWAEKSFVVLILLVNALGFRALARQLGSGSGPVSLWILPLLLSWALFSGFLNFCFAAGVLFCAYTLYLRLDACQGGWGLLGGYAVALGLLVFSHPVPLLLLLLLLGGDTVLLMISGRKVLRVQGVCLGLALLAFAGPVLIADKASVANSLLRDLRPHSQQVEAIASGDRLSVFAGPSPVPLVLSWLLVALAPAAALRMLRGGAGRRLRRGEAGPADRVWLVAWTLLLLSIVFPESMNGSALFADRMVPLLWPFLFAGVAAVPLPARVAGWSRGLAVLATGASLACAGLYLQPAARLEAAMTRGPLPEGKRGLFVAAPAVSRPFRDHLAGELLVWGGARAFAAHHDVLANSPWMQLTIVPVRERGRAGLLRDRLPGSWSESPAMLGQLLRAGGPRAARAMEGVDFLLYSDPAASPAAVALAVRGYLPSGATGWHCAVPGSYAVCQRP